MTNINDEDNPNESAPPAAAEPLGDLAEGSDFAQEPVHEPGEPALAGNGTAPDSPGSIRPKTTAETAENQEKVLAQRVARRTRDVNALMREKECLLLSFVYDKVPKPYYVRWKNESNETFSLLVALKHRQERRLRRRGS